MKRVRYVAAVWILLLTALILAPLCVPGPADIEAVIGGFDIVTPTPTLPPTSTPTSTPTFTPTSTPTTPSGGGDGGGGSGQPSISQPLIIYLLGVETDWRISSEGKVLQDIAVVSDDGSITLDISKGTFALDANHEPLRTITVSRLTIFPDPPPGYSVVCAFDFEPDEATFNPPFTVSVKIDPGMLPSGFTGSGLVAAFFNDDTGEWDFSFGVYDPETQEFTFSISHFTVFAVLASLGAAPTPTLTPVPAATPAQRGLTGLWVALGVIVVGLCFLLIWRRRRTNQSQKKSATDSK